MPSTPCCLPVIPPPPPHSIADLSNTPRGPVTSGHLSETGDYGEEVLRELPAIPQGTRSAGLSYVALKTDRPSWGQEVSE